MRGKSGNMLMILSIHFPHSFQTNAEACPPTSDLHEGSINSESLCVAQYTLHKPFFRQYLHQDPYLLAFREYVDEMTKFLTIGSDNKWPKY